MTSALRRGALAGACLALVGVLGGCVVIGTACSAVGYGSRAEVTLAAPRDGLTLELCDGEGCAPGGVDEPTRVGETGALGETGILSLRGDAVSGWSADLIGGQPTLGYRLRDSEGVVVAEGSVEVEWRRVDGTERCGGNRVASVVLPA